MSLFCHHEQSVSTLVLLLHRGLKLEGPSMSSLVVLLLGGLPLLALTTALAW
jgi:hypothetical protein